MLVAVASGVFGPASISFAQALFNPGFESGGAVCQIVDQFGVWQFDGGDAVGAISGIMPLEGAHMLQFLCTAPCCDRGGSGLSGTSADIAQLVDLSPMLMIVQRGHAVATFSIAVNRVAGNMQTDTQFYAAIRGFHITGPLGFRTGCTSFVQNNAHVQTDILSDSNPATWERIVVSAPLPSDTTVILCSLGAIENVDNGAIFCQEFDGHFADDARLRISNSSCPGDFNLDGVVNSQDFFNFIKCFFSPEICLPPFTADFNTDGAITSQDFFDFLAAFFAGC